MFERPRGSEADFWVFLGIGPKVTQSVLTAALLFAFKDVLYEQTVRLRSTMARKRLAA